VSLVARVTALGWCGDRGCVAKPTRCIVGSFGFVEIDFAVFVATPVRLFRGLLRGYRE
jgi:hypothetical protein